MMNLNAIEQARALDLPNREAVLHRTSAAQAFWHQNRSLLVKAWQEWERKQDSSLIRPSMALLDADLKASVEKAWADSSSEEDVRVLWEEVSPGVYQSQFFDPEKLYALRSYLEKVADAQIPTRPPYGIALNRYGAMLDSRSEGFLAAPSFQDFYQDILNRYMRPIARLLFPEIMGFDTQTFGFSIRYQPGIDTSLQLHTDASAATLNVNINLPDETFKGSEVDFYDPTSGEANRLSFAPGMAMLHRGNVPHAARAITAGSRSNLVFWLYGDQGQIPRFNAPSLKVEPHQRWSVPETAPDHFAPF